MLNVFINYKLSQTYFSYAYYTYFTMKNTICIIRTVTLWPSHFHWAEETFMFFSFNLKPKKTYWKNISFSLKQAPQNTAIEWCIVHAFVWCDFRCWQSLNIIMTGFCSSTNLVPHESSTKFHCLKAIQVFMRNTVH